MFLIYAIFLGLIPATITYKKGITFFLGGWWGSHVYYSITLGNIIKTKYKKIRKGKNRTENKNPGSRK
jgi:hypothetical protein